MIKDMVAPVVKAVLHFLYTDSLPEEMDGADLEVGVHSWGGGLARRGRRHASCFPLARMGGGGGLVRRRRLRPKLPHT